MPAPVCVRCRQPLTPVLPGQREHPMCSPTDTGWIPRQDDHQDQLQIPRVGVPEGLAVALGLAPLGLHILPLAPATKTPLGNCRRCAAGRCDLATCPCLAAGRWCHGVRAATTDPARLAAWWDREPGAIPAVAAGPSGLVLIDLDNHTAPLPPDLATGLLPGIDLAAEPAAPPGWADPARYRDGRDTLRLLAAIRGGHDPWPPGPATRPVTTATPGGGTHLWYRAPAPGLRQALADPAGRHGPGWQIDIKAGWTYGIAPGATTPAGTYQLRSGDPANPGHPPAWLATEIARAASPRPARSPAPGNPMPSGHADPARARYVHTVISRGTARLAAMTDGRKRALSALAMHAGGLLAWSGLTPADITAQLIQAGTNAGLSPADARRRVTQAITNGQARPITPRALASPGHAA